MAALLPITIGWYGKLPARGDFVGHGLPHPWRRLWDDWLQQGLALVQQQLGDAALHDRLRAMPPWQWLLRPAAPGEPLWCGVLAPSHDRVGRRFPLLFAEAYEAATLAAVQLAALQARALQLGDWLYEATEGGTPHDFERGAAAIAATPWPSEAPAGAEPGATVAGLFSAWPGATSFWWCAEPVGDLSAPLAEGWPPRAALMLELLRAPA